jgi:hypothetical protein
MTWEADECLKGIISKRRRGIHLTVGLAYNATIFDYLIENIDSFNWKACGREGHVDKYYARTWPIKKFYADPPVVTPNLDFGSDIS